MPANAIGQKVSLLGAFEGASPGTAPADGYTKLPFVSSTFGGETPIVPADIRWGTRDPLPGQEGQQDVSGDIVVPLELNSLGFWLKAFFGAPVTTGAEAPYSHVFTSGGSPLPVSLEFGHTDVGKYRRSVFVIGNTLNLKRSGDESAQINVSMNFIGGAETIENAAVDASPTVHPFKLMKLSNSAITHSGGSIANVTDFDLTYSNQANIVREFGAYEVKAQDATLTGTITARAVAGNFAALNLTPVTVTFVQTLAAGQSLALAIHGQLQPVRQSVDGADDLERQFNFIGSTSTDLATKMLTATLINSIATYP